LSLQLEETIRCLQAHLQSAESSIEHLKSTVDELRAAVDEKQTKIDVLQAQAIVYREDFNKERLDRQRAHCRLAELETDVDNYMKTMVHKAFVNHRIWQRSAF
jgi:chromosome condensin MukBEF ATPase and DNA-binding subunit MukB